MNKSNMDFGTCIFCEELVLPHEKKFSLAIDRPVRMDLWAHKKCRDEYYNNGTLNQFISENFYSYLDKYQEEDRDGKTKTQKKRGRGKKSTSPDATHNNERSIAGHSDFGSQEI